MAFTESFHQTNDKRHIRFGAGNAAYKGNAMALSFVAQVPPRHARGGGSALGIGMDSQRRSGEYYSAPLAVYPADIA